MEDFIQVQAKNKDEAIIKASIELGTSSDNLEIEVISEGSSGFFGIGSKPAIIRVRRKSKPQELEVEDLLASVQEETIEEVKPAVQEQKEDRPLSAQADKPVKAKAAFKTPKPEVRKERPAKEKLIKEKPVREKTPVPVKEKQQKDKPVKEKPVKVSKPIQILTDPAEIQDVENRAIVFLRDVFQSMNLGEVEITSKYNTTEGSLEVDFEGEDMGILIGKRGQTLDSLQYLTSLVVNKGKDDYIRVKLDTEDYRRRRKETLENLAKGIAYKVKKTRKPVVLEPMNPYERRIIHSALQNNKFVETISEGEEPYRHVVVKLKRG
ncbi:MAG: RNA-binding cell elongation regulator Jag/EloR [Eubacteriales bacterium]|nr:RNA-binding cell elongation regulator Jag/EloR [Eubacteriales bacterium]